MAHYQDFVGLNTFIYDPNGWNIPLQGSTEIVSLGTVSLFQNHLGSLSLGLEKNDHFPYDLLTTASFFNALMSHRGNVYGYSSWRQIRVGNNPLSRKQRENNIFTYVVEPGQILEQKIARYGDIKVFKEPVVVSNYKPISVVGEVSLYNEVIGEFQNKSIEIKTSFGNETAFFANDEMNRYFETIEETDQNYESLKELYLNGGLQDEGSPIDAFNLLVYRQTVFPKQQYSYLDNTRSRNFYVNTFWRDDRADRVEENVDNGFGTAQVPFQSMWPLDVAEDWAIRSSPKINNIFTPYTIYGHYIGGKEGGYINPSVNIKAFNTRNTSSISLFFSESLGGAGVLMNSYSQLTVGTYEIHPDSVTCSLGNATIDQFDKFLSASCYLSRRHTMTNMKSVVSPSGMTIHETGTIGNPIPIDNLFEGLAAWDAGRQAGKTPFYDSYQDWAQEIRLKGKGYSVVPEFRISSHVETYEKKGITEELKPIFELSGGLSQHTTTENALNFYQVLSTTDFLKHFDLVKKDHKDLADEKILTIKCKALKKFLPYEGFYPAQKTVDLAKRFYQSYKDNVTMFSGDDVITTKLGFQGLLEPLFAPGVLFNTIKSGIAVDYPIITNSDDPTFIRTNSSGVLADDENDNFTVNYSTYYSNNMVAPTTGISPTDYEIASIFTKRIGFEALLDPEKFLSNLDLKLQEPHPFGLSEFPINVKWDGQGDRLYKKMINNFLAEVPEFFLQKGQLTTIVSEEEQNPEFGNAVSGNFYTMRIKMKRSRNKDNDYYDGIDGTRTFPPQDAYPRMGIQETFTMYSRPTAFGPPVWGGIQSGSMWNTGEITEPLGDLWGSNYCYTPPYYYGEAWCDVIFECTQTKKYTVDEILSKVKQYPYYTRFWWPGVNDALRDLTGYLDNDTLHTTYPTGPYETYSSSSWKKLITNGWDTNDSITIVSGNVSSPEYSTSWGQADTSWPTEVKWANSYLNNGFGLKQANPQHPSLVNTNAMQLNSSVNLFSKGTVRSISNNLSEDGSTFEVASADTVKGKTRWIIQTKFETPMLNFNKYTNLDNKAHKLTKPTFAAESVPRGIWHQYGEIPEDPKTGVFLQVEDIPESWFKGALGVNENYTRKKVKSLADLVGFRKEPVKLGQVADLKEISEAVVAVPFIEKDGTRKFFSIPRTDIDSCIDATKRETGEGRFVLGGPPKAGDTVYKMVKNMQKYVFPPSMDFVKYEEVEPFAMYIFEFKHNLSKKDVADIWQNLPPEIGSKMEESEASISHELLAHELLGGGSVIKNGMLDENAEGQGIPSNIQWMIFKVKKRAKTNYYDKVVEGSGTTQDTSKKTLENVTSAKSGKIEKDITYNWPYDYFSLVELVKLDAEVTFAQIGNDDKGQKTIKKVEPPKPKEGETPFPKLKAKGLMKALGKGKKGKGK